ncbi:MAG: pyridoxal phosphate-dependent aminotransferase [Thermoanaerobaculia bacterium]
MSRAAIAAMTAYTLELRDADIKLNQNESPEDLPRAFKEELFRRVAARPWNRYPDFELTELRTALARANGLEPDQILAGNGSNELLAATVATFVGAGTPVVIPRPTFALYEKLVAIAGGTVIPIDIDPSTGLLPLDAMVRAAGPSSVVIVCSPNNPTGGVLPAGGVDALLATGATVLLDRAYGEFEERRLESRRHVDSRLITFLTFSKAWGLAGLRVGWLASTTDTCREIRKVKLPYSLNIVSEAGAILALENPWLRDRNVERVRKERARVMAALGDAAFPSEANFILFRARPGLFEDLLAKGILVRSYAGFLRVTIGLPEENDAFLAAMKELT